MAGYTYRGTVFDAGGRASSVPIRHGASASQYNRCRKRELGACEACRRTRAAYQADRRARAAVPTKPFLQALKAFAELDAA